MQLQISVHWKCLRWVDPNLFQNYLQCVSVVLVTVQRSISETSRTNSPCEICQDSPQQSVLHCDLFSPAWSPRSFSPLSSKQPQNDATHWNVIAFWIKANCSSVPLCSAHPWCRRAQLPEQLGGEERAVHCADTRGLPPAAIIYGFAARG